MLAEPARTPGPVDGDGRVIPFSPRHLPPADTPAADERLVALTETVEAMFIAHGMTLSDPRVADAFRVSLDVALLMVDGAAHEQVIGGEAHTLLRGVMENVRLTPIRL
ncbi:hypothetical protein [Streptomyces sp. DH12]|uniref:hypothetical protein n=1 Tax=Streptomyces sp. DH12 TaxID=2857010 RepID=UPI001E384D42|nr:hypothetical protein [Streptomyces sp. DH12]